MLLETERLAIVARIERCLLATLALASAVSCAAGHGRDAATCGEDPAFYDATYHEQTGTCGAFEGYPVALEQSLASTIQLLSDGTRVTNESSIHDCRVHLVQWAQHDGGAVRIEGDPLRFRSDGAIDGMVEIQRFDEQGEVTCRSEYAAVLTRRDAGQP